LVFLEFFFPKKDKIPKARRRPFRTVGYRAEPQRRPIGKVRKISCVDPKNALKTDSLGSRADRPFPGIKISKIPQFSNSNLPRKKPKSTLSTIGGSHDKKLDPMTTRKKIALLNMLEFFSSIFPIGC
jgi:hypothetical protein